MNGGVINLNGGTLEIKINEKTIVPINFSEPLSRCSNS